MPIIRRITAFLFCCCFLQNPFADDLRHIWLPESPIISGGIATYGALAAGFLLLCACAVSIVLGMRGAL